MSPKRKFRIDFPFTKKQSHFIILKFSPYFYEINKNSPPRYQNVPVHRNHQSFKTDMEKRATHATQGRGNFYIIAEISSTIGAKWMFSIKTRPLLCLK